MLAGINPITIDEGGVIMVIKEMLSDRWARYCLIALGIWLLMPISLLMHSHTQELEYNKLVAGFCYERLIILGSLPDNIEVDGRDCWDKTDR